MKCLHCGQRKGKRPCPALHGLICSPCCGAHRLVHISCPSDCVFLDSNVDYQQKRLADRFEQDRQQVYRDLRAFGNEQACEIFYILEALTFRYFQGRVDAQDGEVIAGIQSLRRSFSPIHVSEGMAPAFGEELKKEYKTLHSQKTVATHLVPEVLDRAVQFITRFSEGGLRSNRFLNGLIGYIKHRHPDVAEQLARQTGAGGRIIIPSGVTLDE